MTEKQKPGERQAPSNRKVRTFGFVGLLILGLAGGYCFGLLRPGPTASDTAPAIPASVQPTRQVTALGEVLPISDQVTVAAPTGQDAGRIAEIRVTEGAQVMRGDVLAVMDTEPVLRAALDQAMADEGAREVALAARTADLDATGAQLEAQVHELTVALERAQLDLDRMTQLRDSGLYEDSALAEKRLDVEAARFNLQNTELKLQRNRLQLPGGLRIDEASAKAELASATAARKRSEADFAKTRILAPMDGRVLAIFGKLGEQIGADGFALMGDTQRMIVRAEVYESDIGGVAVGQKAAVTSRALAGTLTGTVTRTGIRIADQSILSTDPAAIVDARVIEVWITLDEGSSAATADLTGLQVLVTFALKDDGNA